MAEQTKPVDLQELSRLYDATNGRGSRWAATKRGDGSAKVYATSIGVLRACRDVAETLADYADFIAASHNAFPALRDELSRLRKENEELRKVVANAADFIADEYGADNDDGVLIPNAGARRIHGALCDAIAAKGAA